MANDDRAKIIPRRTPESAAMSANVKRAMAITANLNRLTINDADEVALRSPVYMPPSRALQSLLIAESPPAFRSRLIFTGAEPLERARFPRDVERIRMPWDDRASK